MPRPANFQCDGFVIVSHLDSCSRPVGEFLVPRVDAAFPLLTLWEQGAGPVRWFSSETIMCWFTVRGRAHTPTVSFLLGSDCQAYRTEGVYEKQIERREGGWWVMWKVVVFKVLCSECQTVCWILSWDLEDVGEWAEHSAGEPGRDGSPYVHSVWKGLLLIQRSKSFFFFCWDGTAEVCLELDSAARAQSREAFMRRYSDISKIWKEDFQWMTGVSI